MKRDIRLMSSPMRIEKYPYPTLLNKCDQLDEWTVEHSLIAQGMIALAGIYGCRSLSANQVGFNYNFFVIYKDIPEVIINPEILEVEQDTYEYMREGCMSVSHILYYISRPGYIRVRYNDTRFNTIERSVSGLESKIFLHEVDHLNGKLIINYFTQEEKNEFERRFK